MQFAHVATVFAHIRTISKRTEITEKLAELYTAASAHEAQYITYLALGSLRPPYQENVFGLAEKSLIKVAAELCTLSESDIKKLLKKHGDIGDIIEQAAWHGHRHLSITELYNTLITLTEIKGTGSQEERLSQLTQVLKSVSTQEAACIVRIISGKLRLGFSDMTIIDALSWMIAANKSLHSTIEHAYNLCADLGLIAYKLKAHGIESIKNITMHIGIPVRPAAAERLESPEEIFEKVGVCVAQPKIDGFRLQVHIDLSHKKPIIHFFSRNLLDMSTQFPDLAAAAAELPVTTAIIEGEAICYDAHHHAFLPFQETVKRKRKHDITAHASELPLTLFIFDILYLNGESCIQKSHAERRAILTKLCSRHQSRTLKLIEEHTMHSAASIEHYFHDAIEQGLEGIMIKRPNAHYQPGKRNFNWIKLKRTETTGGLADTIDAVIVGYYAGKGKRAQFGIGALLVALYDPKKDSYYTVAKIGTGLSDTQWQELKKKCDAHATATQPHQVHCDEQLIPDVWVTPKLVCAIRADEITRSPLHTAGAHSTEPGYALRFPRFLELRHDKNPTDATTVHEIIQLYQLAHEKRSATSQ